MNEQLIAKNEQNFVSPAFLDKPGRAFSRLIHFLINHTGVGNFTFKLKNGLLHDSGTIRTLGILGITLGFKIRYTSHMHSRLNQGMNTRMRLCSA